MRGVLDFLVGSVVGVQGWSFGDLHNGVLAGGYLVGAGMWLETAGTGRPDALMAGAGAAVLLAGSFFAWLLCVRRYDLIADVPRSNIASAAQGYVELMGRSEAYPGNDTLGFGMLPPCLWYRVRSCDRGGRSTSYFRSDDTFLVADGSGKCVIDPDGAEIVTSLTRSWTSENTSYKAWYLRPGDTLYALGNLTTEGGAGAPLDRDTDVAALLHQWKQDPESLLQRFDENRDGRIDMQEWAKARREAERVVDARHAEIRSEPGINILRAPTDGRPFLLSNRPAASLARRYLWWSRLHVAVLVATATCGLVWLAHLS